MHLQISTLNSCRRIAVNRPPPKKPPSGAVFCFPPQPPSHYPPSCIAEARTDLTRWIIGAGLLQTTVIIGVLLKVAGLV
ncbi:hypothetical protein CKO17_12025 [Marichromatium gracile]|nr:hypothetical protein [Marichromatium gracile]